MQRFKNHAHKITILLTFLVIANLGLTGCANMVDFENSQVVNQDAIGQIGPAQTLGQTISVRRAPIDGIYLWIRPASDAPDPDGKLVFRIYAEETTNHEIYAGQIPYQQLASNFPVYITFPGIQVKVGDKIFLQLEATGSPLWVYGRNEDAYPDGAASQNGNIQNSDLAFRLAYPYTINSLLSDVWKLITSLWLVLPLGLLLIVPGWLAVHLSGVDTETDLVSSLGIIIGVSLALLPVVVTWTSLLKVHWNQLAVIGVYLILAFVSIAMLIRQRGSKKLASPAAELASNPKPKTVRAELSTLLLIGLIFVCVLVVRFAMVRDLSAPAWVDAVHHSLLARIIQTDGLIPASFSPFANVQSTNYHTGFHVSLAFFSWLSGLELIDASLILGQVLNAAIIFPVYLLGYTLTKNKVAGLAAALVAGFVTPMPAYYTSWSRFTQLVGLLILPAGFALLRPVYDLQLNSTGSLGRSLGEHLGKFWPRMLISAITLGGLFLVHYRVAAFFICLLVADYLFSLLDNWRSIVRFFWLTLPSLLITSMTAMLLASPNLFLVVKKLLPQRAAERALETVDEKIRISFSFLTAGLGRLSLVTAGIGLLVAFLRNFRLAAVLIVWSGLLFFLANSEKLGLPTKGLISNDSVVISLFLPISICIGYLVGLVYDALQNITDSDGHWTVDLGFIAVGMLIAVFGAQALLPIINPSTVFFRQADRKAAIWIEENLPMDATFLINPAAWGYSNFIGSDGGYWISPLTGRLTFPPTLLYGHGNLDDIRTINTESRQLMNILNQPDQICQFMQKHKIQYLYLGANGGPISPRAILHSSKFDPIYHQDGVWVFQLLDSQ